MRPKSSCATAEASCDGALQVRYLNEPQRYYVTRQPRHGDGYVHGARSRFLTPAVLACMDATPLAGPADAGDRPVVVVLALHQLGQCAVLEHVIYLTPGPAIAQAFE